MHFGLFLDLRKMLLICEEIYKMHESLWQQGSLEEAEGNI